MSLRVNKSTAKHAFKGIGRQVEKMKLGFGMVEQTKDDNLALLVNKYFQHQHGSTKFLKSLREYFECQKAIHAALLQLQASLSEFYDVDWVNRDEMIENFTHVSLLYEQYICKISDRIIDPFTQYLSRFPYYKDKLDKRGRKLLDYDSCKREVETFQTKILRNKDAKDPKLIIRLTTLENDFHNAKEQYDRITDELYEDLTLLNNNRVIFSARILEYFYQAQETLFQEMKLLSSSSLDSSSFLHERGIEHAYDLEVSREITDCGIEKLSTILFDEAALDSSTSLLMQSSSIEKGGLLQNNSGKWKVSKQVSLESDPDSDYFRRNTGYIMDTSSISTTSEERLEISNNFFVENMVIVPTNPTRDGFLSHKHSLDSKLLELQLPRPKKPSRPQTFFFHDSSLDDFGIFQKLTEDCSQAPNDSSICEEDHALVQLQRLQRQRTLSVLENIPNILYRVTALFDYSSNNSDELQLCRGDHISVIFDSTYEIDEGWLMGEHEQSHKKGIFPANHTKLL